METANTQRISESGSTTTSSPKHINIFGNVIYTGFAVALMFFIMACLVTQWMCLSRRIKLKKPSNRFNDIESGYVETLYTDADPEIDPVEFLEGALNELESADEETLQHELNELNELNGETPRQISCNACLVPSYFRGGGEDYRLLVTPASDESPETSSHIERRFRSFPKSASYIGSPAALDKVTRLIRHTCKTSLARSSGKCGLCGQDICEGDVIRTLPCDHSFHNLCILRWLVLSQLRCPTCQDKLQLS